MDCQARHPETGAICELPLGHTENHRGPFKHGTTMWPVDSPTAVLLDPPPAEPIRPVKEYEEIIIREVSVGFSGGTQDFTLYPEDTMESDTLGNIRVVFHTLGGGEFVAYAGHTQWHSLKETKHQREKGTLRPDPVKIAQEFQARKVEERRQSRARV